MTSVNSTQSTNTTTSLTSQKGLGGLISGLNTDELVYNLTTTERGKINKQEQEIQTLEWKQEAYRDIITKMQEFEKKYLDILSKTNLRTAGSFNTISASSSSDAVSVRTNSGSYATNITIDNITQLATGKTIKGVGISAPLSSSLSLVDTIAAEDPDADVSDTLMGKLAGKSFSLTVDGTVKTISFDGIWAEDIYKDAGGNPIEKPTAESFTAALQKKLDSAFGAGRVTASLTESGSLRFDTTYGSQVSISAVSGNEDALELLGFQSKQSNKITAGIQLSEMEKAFNTNLSTSFKGTDIIGEGSDKKEVEYGLYKFNINGVDFEIKDTTSLQSIMSEINSSKAGVTLSYSSITDSFTMVSKATGQSSDITLSDYSDEDGSSNFLQALGLVGSSAQVTEGTNAIFSVNGVEITRESNESIEVDGVFISLNKTTNEATNITMSSDTSNLKDNIVQFVNDYNEMIEMINKARTEKTESKYQPLTDEQKKEMSESEIEKWNEKAKSGVLRNDSVLNSISSKLSTLMYTSFNGFSMYEMGIQSSGYSDNGKLTINEDKLDKALANNTEKVKNFFYGDTGFSNALKGVVDSAIKTSGPKGSRGSLIERAGIKNTLSDTENIISEKISALQKYVEQLQEKLTSRETYWWNKFSALEILVNQMNSYSSVISSYSSMG